jgi:hypothetical protein
MTMDSPLVLAGGCLCGAVRYRIMGRPRSSSTCFCHSCRRASGAASVAWFVVGASECALDAEHLARFRSSAGVTRGFCARCGTSLTYQRDDALDELELTTASLDEPHRMPPTHEIWHVDRVPWAASDASLPRFRQERPETDEDG